MSCLILVLFVTELLYFVDLSSSGNDYIISDDKSTWVEAAMKSPENEANHIFDFFRKEIQAEKLKLNEKYWIPARANYTPYFSWKGCVKKKPRLGVCWNETFILEENSIDTCSTQCSKIKADRRFFMKGTECLCSHQVRCFAPQIHSCDDPCPGNWNDFCGSSSRDFYSMYYSSTNADHTSSAAGQHCLYSSNGHLTADSCWNDSIVIGFLYSDPGTRHQGEFTLNTTISWRAAVKKCFESGFEFIEEYKPRGNAGETNKKFWSSLRRSLRLKWTTIADANFPFCVTIRRVKNNTFIIEEDDCSRQYHYITKDNGPLLWLLLLLLIPLGLILVLLLKGIKKSRFEDFRKRETSIGNKMYGEIIPAIRQNERSPAALYHYAEVEGGPIYSKPIMSSDASVPERSVTVSAYQVTTLDSNEYNHINDVSGNVYNTTRSPTNQNVKVTNNIYSAVQPKHIDSDTNSSNVYNNTNEKAEHMIDGSTYGWKGARLQMSNLEINDAIASTSQGNGESGTLESEKDGGYETVFFKKVVED